MRKSFIFNHLALISAAFSILALSSGCDPKSQNQKEIQAEQVVKGYADLVYAAYNDALESAQTLQITIWRFLDVPSHSNLEEAKAAWRNARTWYAQTEAFRFYDGPIDNGENGVEGLLNAWPLDEAYVDYVEGAPAVGIIYDVAKYPEITADLLVSMNEKGGEENISCGYHAIEFMLWGQDLDTAAAGQRPYQDFLPGDPIRERRRTYLQLTTNLLVEHLTRVRDQWSTEVPTNYRAAFERDSASASLQKILTGIGVLAKVELAGERMYTAYDNADQEDEQSCFSDNTRDDLINNFKGIMNVYYGKYIQLNGDTLAVPSMHELLLQTNPELAAQTEVQLQNTAGLIAHIPQPFDRAIVLPDQREMVMQAILAVQESGEQFSRVAETLGLTINVRASE